MDKYEQLAIVGEGSYGLVMKCRHRETDQIVAIKKFLETEEDATIRKMALREIRMLKRLKHENLVTMIEVFRHRKRFYLVFEYLEGTVLDELDKMPSGLGDERCRERIFQVIRAISYCHNNHIIHRDVKPENVLVSSLGVVKLCDFGFARIISSNGDACTEYVATRWYRAPELLVCEPNYGIGVDVWAIGCLFSEMMTGDPLFPGESDIDQLYLIVKLLGKPCWRHQQLISKNVQLKSTIKIPGETEDNSTFHKKFPSWPLHAIDFLTCCLRMDPAQRHSADDLLKHTYFLHDRFPQRFLPALREKVNIEFSNPLLRKFRTEILMSTDKKDESKMRRPFLNDSKWRFTLAEGSMKRKLSCDTLSTSENNIDKNLITLSNTQQRLNVLQRSNQSQFIRQPSREKTIKNVNLESNNGIEMEMLEKSLESLAKFHNKNEELRPASAEKQNNMENLLPSGSPPPFHSFHFGFGDSNKSPNIHPVLHPSINNISFNKNPPKRSPNVLQSIHTGHIKFTQVPLLSNSRSKFMKKTERNVPSENLFGTGDQSNWNNTPTWFSSFNSNVQKKKERKTKADDFSLPNVPGATVSPSRTKKKSLPEIELPHSTEVTPRIQSSTSQKMSPSSPSSSNTLNIH